MSQTDRDRHNHGIESRLILVRVFALIQHSPTNGINSPRSSRADEEGKGKGKEEKEVRAAAAAANSNRTEQRDCCTSVGGHESCTERHWLVPHWLCLINE